MARWSYDPEFAALSMSCLQELAPERPGLKIWAECFAIVEEDEAACLSECPATVDACLNAGNEAGQMCKVGYEADQHEAQNSWMTKRSQHGTAMVSQPILGWNSRWSTTLGSCPGVDA